jgi:hypothetical protein
VAAGVDRGHEAPADRERQEHARLVGDGGHRQRLPAAQRLDERQADEGRIAEAAGERQCADPGAAPAGGSASGREERPAAEEHEPHRDRREPQRGGERKARHDRKHQCGQRDVDHPPVERVGEAGGRAGGPRDQRAEREASDEEQEGMHRILVRGGPIAATAAARISCAGSGDEEDLP